MRYRNVMRVAATAVAAALAGCAPVASGPTCPTRTARSLPVVQPQPDPGYVALDPLLRVTDLSPNGRFGVGRFAYRRPPGQPSDTRYEAVLVDIATGSSERFALAADRTWTLAVNDAGDVVALGQDDQPGLLRRHADDSQQPILTPPARRPADGAEMSVGAWLVSADTNTLVRNDTYAVWNAPAVRYNLGGVVTVIDRITSTTRRFDLGDAIGVTEFPETATAVSAHGSQITTQRYRMDPVTGTLRAYEAHTPPPASTPPAGAVFGDVPRRMEVLVTDDGRRVTHWAIPGSVSGYPAWFGGYVAVESTDDPPMVVTDQPISNPWSIGISADGSRLMASRSESGIEPGHVYETDLTAALTSTVATGVIGGAYSDDLRTFAGWVTDAAGDHFEVLTCTP